MPSHELGLQLLERVKRNADDDQQTRASKKLGIRGRHIELLDHEAPTRGGYRQRLVDRFNEGFRIQERRSPRCGAEEEMVRQTLAIEGEALSEQLRRTYLQ